MTGIIVMWSGSVETIPSGWKLCNGQFGTPNLRNRFVIGAIFTAHVGNIGGNIRHAHDFTGDGHDHTLPAGTKMNEGGGRDEVTTQSVSIGTTDSAEHTPPYYALCFIMKMAEPE